MGRRRTPTRRHWGAARPAPGRRAADRIPGPTAITARAHPHGQGHLCSSRICTLTTATANCYSNCQTATSSATKRSQLSSPTRASGPTASSCGRPSNSEGAVPPGVLARLARRLGARSRTGNGSSTARHDLARLLYAIQRHFQSFDVAFLPINAVLASESAALVISSAAVLRFGRSIRKSTVFSGAPFTSAATALPPSICAMSLPAAISAGSNSRPATRQPRGIRVLGEVVKNLVPRCLRADQHVRGRFEVRFVQQ
jgi:hypothetical protein